MILDVAVTGVDGQFRASDDFPDRPLQIRYDQKMAKYGQIADQNRLQFVPAVFSHTGQIHGAFKSLFGEQIRQNLVAFEGQAKPFTIKSVIKWSKCISMVIAKTASRNVAFKAAKIADSAFAGQSENLTRKIVRNDVPPTRRLWMTWDATRIYTSFTRTSQIVNKSTMLGLVVSYSSIG